jgi:hypothetical protein
MKDTIVQQVRDARAAVAADFDFDLHKFFAWAKVHTDAERKAKHWLTTDPNMPLQGTPVSRTPSIPRSRARRP